MQKIINETEEMAYIYLKAFGFREEEIAPIVKRGKKDLETTLIKLHNMLDRNYVTDQELDDILHSLKGLLFHMGNNTLAQEVDEIRNDTNRKNLEHRLTILFFDI